MRIHSPAQIPALLALLFATSLMLGTIPCATADVTINIPHYKVISPNKFLAGDKITLLKSTAKSFEALFGVVPPKGTVILDKVMEGGYKRELKVTPSWTLTRPENPEDGLWLLRWYKTRLPKNYLSSGHALTHEVAHVQFTAYVMQHYKPKGGIKYDGYGTYLPDWLDEGIAVYHEVKGFQKIRRSFAKKSKPWPLETFVTMRHPIISKQDGVQLFYAQSLALVDYLVDTAGLPVIRHAIYQYSLGQNFDNLIQSWNAKIPDIRKAQAKATTKKAVMVHGFPIRKGETVKPLKADLAKTQQDFTRWLKLHY